MELVPKVIITAHTYDSEAGREDCAKEEALNAAIESVSSHGISMQQRILAHPLHCVAIVCSQYRSILPLG